MKRARVESALRRGSLALLVLGGVASVGPVNAAAGASGPQVKAGPLKPLLVQVDRIKLRDDFDKPKPLDTKIWKPIQSTRWAIEEGVLKGIPATPEFQASRQDHNGPKPVMDIKGLGDFAIDVKIKFEGKALGRSAIDFDHHILAVRFTEHTVGIYEHSGKEPVSKSTGFEVKTGQWYHVLAEVKGDTLVVQFERGPTLVAQSAPLAAPKGEIRFIGPMQGAIQLDDLTIWSVKPEPQPSWAATRAKLP